MLTWEKQDRQYLLNQREFLRSEIARRSQSSSYHDQFIREVYQCALKELEDQLFTDGH